MWFWYWWNCGWGNGEIFDSYMADIYDVNSPDASVGYDLGTDLARVRVGGAISKLCKYQKFPPI